MDPAHGAIKSGEPPKPAVPVRAEPTLSLSWPIGVQIAVILIVTASLFFLLGRWSLDGSRPQPVLQDRASPALDLNRATKAELRLIPGLGDALAQRLIDQRQRHGPFCNVDELRQVSGIGPKTLERIRPHLFVTMGESPVSFDDDEMTPTESKQRSTQRAAGPSKKETQLAGSINVNRANQTELQKLPGIGPKLSQRLLDERAKASFKSIEDLRRVPGIGPKTLEKLRPYVTIE